MVGDSLAWSPMLEMWPWYSHQQLYDFVRTNANGPAAVDVADETWTEFITLMRESQEDVDRLLAESGASWEGTASEYMSGAVTPLAQWAEDSMAAGERSKAGVDFLRTSFAHTANAMPEPVPVPSRAAGIPGDFTGLFRGQTDQEPVEQQADAAHRHAVDLMTTWTRSAGEATSGTGEFVPPQDITAGTSPRLTGAAVDTTEAGIATPANRPDAGDHRQLADRVDFTRIPDDSTNFADHRPATRVPGGPVPPGGLPQSSPGTSPPGSTTPSSNSPVTVPVGTAPTTGTDPNTGPPYGSGRPTTGGPGGIGGPATPAPGGAPGSVPGGRPGSGGARGGPVARPIAGEPAGPGAGARGVGATLAGPRTASGMGMAPLGAAGSGKEEDKEHTSAVYLRDTHDDFWDDTPVVAPPVIGEEDD